MLIVFFHSLVTAEMSYSNPKLVNLKLIVIMGIDQEVEFHEIKIQFFMRSKFSFSWDRNYFCSWGRICSLIFDSVNQEVDTSIMRSKFLIMIRFHDRFVSCKYNHEIEIQNKALLGNFDLIIDLLAASTIMRSNDFMHRWLKIKAKN